jgi:hypothetical protein
MHALLMGEGCRDFRTGFAYDLRTYFDERTDIHHIFPQAWCKAKGIDAKRCDSIVNKTPISAGTNRKIGGNAPSVYLASLQKSAKIEDARMDEILRTHLIDPAALRADDFDRFFEARSQALLAKIKKAMGKTVAGESVGPDGLEFSEYEDPEFVDDEGGGDLDSLDDEGGGDLDSLDDEGVAKAAQAHQQSLDYAKQEIAAMLARAKVEEGEKKLAQAHQQALDSSGGKQSANVSELCQQYGISPERAGGILNEVWEKWQKDHKR